MAPPMRLVVAAAAAAVATMAMVVASPSTVGAAAAVEAAAAPAAAAVNVVASLPAVVAAAVAAAKPAAVVATAVEAAGPAAAAAAAMPTTAVAPAASPVDLVAGGSRWYFRIIGRCHRCGPYVRGRCTRGTVCAKISKGAFTCVAPVGVGKRCTAPCWTCSRGLTCGRRGTCEVPTIRQCHRCGYGIRGRCQAGTRCAKNNKGVLSCVKAMGVGKKCTDPCWTCASGLKCGRRGTCELPIIRQCQKCGPGILGRCQAGTRCAKNNKGVLSCVKAMGVGKKCTDPCWTCASGLKCGRRGTCELPIIRQCQKCGPGILGRCQAGTRCAKNNKGVLSCVKMMGVGKKCTDPCWTCAPGLACNSYSHTCVRRY